MGKKVDPVHAGRHGYDQTAPVPGTDDLDNPQRERSTQEMYLDEHGREIPNPVPMDPPVGYVKSPSIADLIRQQIKAVSAEAAMAGFETEEEANDFDIGDDDEPHSPWENDFDIDPVYEHMLARMSAPPSPSAPSKAAEPPKPAGDREPSGVERPAQ